MNFFNDIGLLINGIIHLSPKEAFKCCKNGALILDLRREAEVAYKSFDVPEIIYSDPKQIKANFQNLPKESYIIVADNAGLRSKAAVEFLIEKGFDNIANLAGGMFEWDRDRLPIATNNKERLSGSCLCMLKPMNKIRKP